MSYMIYLLEMIVLYSYIKLPEGVCIQHYYRDDLWNSEIDAEYIINSVPFQFLSIFAG
jgi:hypothetical protein